MNQIKVNSAEVTSGQVIILIVLAYLFSFMVRMIWIWQFHDYPNFFWNDQLMINTNDGYFFASGVQKELWGLHETNPRVFEMWDYGVIFFSTLLIKITPFSLETIILYMPSIISSLVVIPIILISKLFNQALWGFLAALLGSIAWSYYNRTMVGYYDTDMFSSMAPMFILYFLMKSTIDFNLRSALYAALAITVYPFLYDQGKAIIYAMGIIYAIYTIYYHRNENTTYASLILVFIALTPFPVSVPSVYLLKVIVLAAVYLGLQKDFFTQKQLMSISLGLFILFLLRGNVLGLIAAKTMSYLATGTKDEGLHFYSVVQTVREAGQIPFSMFANRISGSQVGVLISLVGYLVLVVRHKTFILALPLVGIGIFALFGGLRFTVYAVPIAAISAVYLFFVFGSFFKNIKLKYTFIIVATGGMLYPNIQHIIAYRVPTVLNVHEVRDLDKLNQIADSKDYTLAWWDYGYPIWYYSNTSTLIDGGKHHNDNFIISKIMQTPSPILAANLSRLAVETYVDSNYSIVSDTLFKNGKKDQLDPNVLLSKWSDPDYSLPTKTRDIYLYFPHKMMNIFPTVALFGNLDLTTGKPERKLDFYPTQAVSNTNGILKFTNGLTFDTHKGNLSFGKEIKRVKYLITTENKRDGGVKLHSQPYYSDGDFIVIFLKSYRQFVIMDRETYNSMYVQMYMLENYDKNLFELVVSSPYSKIYKLKR